MRKGERRAGSSRTREATSRGSRAWRPVASRSCPAAPRPPIAALNPQFGAGPGAAPLDRLIVSAGEHLCVLAGHRFPAAEIAPLRPDGRLDLDWLEAACRRPGRALLALQGANNETGVVQPVVEAAALVHAAGGLVFCDAVQMAGRMDCSIAALGADALMLSAHKIGGMKGAGALVTARAGISLGAPLHAGRGPGAQPSGGHRGRYGDCGLRRRRARVPAGNGERGGAARWAARPSRRGRPLGRRRCGHLLGRRPRAFPTPSTSPRPASRRRR